MSRIIVKNIPKIFSEKEIVEHFSKVDQITDCKVARLPNGESRRFAFLGFKGANTASTVKASYDNTYVGASKVRIEIAWLKNGEEESRERSRDESKNKKQGKKEEQRTHIYENYKKMIEDKAKKSWDDLVVFHHHDMSQFEKLQKQPKSKQKDEKEVKAVVSNDNQFQENGEKPIKAPRLTAKNKKFVTKPLEIDSNRLYITNIPYNLSEEQIKNSFSRFGNIKKIKIPREYDGKNKGYFFLTFDKSEQALRAFSECDNKILFGRIVHIKPSLQDIGEMISTGKQSEYQEKVREKYGDLMEEKSSYKKKKKRQMRERLNDTTNWNTLFLNPNTILERIAKKLHITKSEILLSQNLAPKVALAEAQVIQETKTWMTQNGLDLSFLEKDRSLCERSKKAIIIKNLNFRVQESELKELLQFYGILQKCLLAPNRAIAVAEFQNPQFAENAMKNLQQQKFKNNFLFLEYAPVGMLNEVNVTKKIEELKKQEAQGEELSKVVYIKNLSFNTEEGELYTLFEKIDAIKYAKIVRGKDGRSMGFGFVQYGSPEKAIQAVKKLNNTLVDGHKLILSLSRKKAQKMEDVIKMKEKIKAEEEKSSKLMIRNVAFQATKNEIKQLFQEFGSLKKVRLPKKMDGQHRGFAFVEYDTAEEAALAREALSSAHLYGRKLVIEYEKGSN